MPRGRFRSLPAFGASLGFLCGFWLLLFVAAPAQGQVQKLIGGVTFCLGFHVNSSNQTLYHIQNFNSRLGIKITRLRMWDANGTRIRNFPSPSNPFPTGFRQRLPPRQSTTLTTAGQFGDTPQVNPLQVLIEWKVEGKKPAFPPEVTRVRVTPNSVVPISCEIGDRDVLLE